MNKLENAVHPLQARFEGMAALCDEAAKSRDQRIHVDTLKVLAIQVKELLRLFIQSTGWR